MKYPMRAFVLETQTWHDIAKYEVLEDGIHLISTQKDRDIPLFGGGIQHIVISPEILNEMLCEMQKGSKAKVSRRGKSTVAADAETKAEIE